MNRIVGLETEYGCLAAHDLGPLTAVGKVRNWIFHQHRYGLVDIHQRDWDEPAGNGGFLFNGGRAYVDMGHLELCTPECRSLRDLVCYDRAGDRMLNQATQDLGLQERISFVRNNLDYYSGATFGCHENYLVRRDAPLTERTVLSLLAFLTLRVLYTGAGRLGEAPGSTLTREDETPVTPDFQISQRADFIQNDLFEWVQFNRAIINTRDEPLADATRYRRLHLLHGDTSVLPETLALKIGTTALVLDLLEINAIPSVALADAVLEYRLLSRQLTRPWLVTQRDGHQASAVELLRRYQEAAGRAFRGRDAETDWLLDRWAGVLDALETEPSSLVGSVDWVTKHWLFTQFVEREGTSWLDPWLKAQDLEFHHTDPERSLALPLALGAGPMQVDAEAVECALDQPPTDTRAAARSAWMRRLSATGVQRYYLDWEAVDAEGVGSVMLLDPFDPTPPEAQGTAH